MVRKPDQKIKLISQKVKMRFPKPLVTKEVIRPKSTKICVG